MGFWKDEKSTGAIGVYPLLLLIILFSLGLYYIGRGG